MAAIALPFVEAEIGMGQHGKLWEKDHRTVANIRRIVRDVFQPHNMYAQDADDPSNHMSSSCDERITNPYHISSPTDERITSVVRSTTKDNGEAEFSGFRGEEHGVPVFSM